MLKKTQSGAWSSVRLGGLGPYASSTFSTSTGKKAILYREPKVDGRACVLFVYIVTLTN